MTIGLKIPASLANLPAKDHRIIGARQKLFFFSEFSAGSCFFLSRGARIYNKLIEYLRSEYKKRNYDEVITPNIFQCDLWKTSGHWEHYNEDIMKFDIGERKFSLKPMNCPGHCLMYKNSPIRNSYELPIRWADFGVLHRNEPSGTISGLTRVRRFQQDDAHIFCTPQQVESEIMGCLEFTSKVYHDFGFDYHVKLSSRPENFLGDTALWDTAENSLRNSLDKFKISWEEQSFEGAFYGPKIDLIVKDKLNRAQQCATIQLDFQLPRRFELKYKEGGEIHTPVIIHRAILGSLERFIAMICENCDGRWPFWLSPLQAVVIPIHDRLNEHALRVKDRLRQNDLWVDCDTRNMRLNAKIREALTTPYSMILIIGDDEAESDSVMCRINDGSKVHNIKTPIDEMIQLMREFEKRRVNRADLELAGSLADRR